jgi:hypothetical protein
MNNIQQVLHRIMMTWSLYSVMTMMIITCDHTSIIFIIYIFHIHLFPSIFSVMMMIINPSIINIIIIIYSAMMMMMMMIDDHASIIIIYSVMMMMMMVDDHPSIIIIPIPSTYSTLLYQPT